MRIDPCRVASVDRAREIQHMCGLAGKVVFDGNGVRPELLKRMCDSLVHRGPDDQGFYIDGSVGFGHRRLSIIDLATGRQPISNEDRSIWVMLNGEIYNYVELRADLQRRGHRFATASDTEVIAHLYEERGERCLDSLRGMFAIALWDARSNALLLARDRVGKKPLYYAQLAHGIVFASELRALSADPDVRRDLDLEALDAFLSLQYVPTPLTMFKGVRKLPAGHFLRCSRNGVTLHEYWDVSFDDVRDDGRRWGDELRSCLEEAVRIRLRSDVPLGAFLSGGLDSSTIVAFMAEQLPNPVITCTATFDESAHDERHEAHGVAVRFGCEHHEKAIQPNLRDLPLRLAGVFDEPFADPAAIPNYLIAEAAREHVKVALSGDGGDELFAGYWRHAREQTERRLRAFGPVATTMVPALAPWLAPPGRRAGLARLGMPVSQAYAWKHSGIFFDDAAKADLYARGLADACRQFDPSARFREYYDRCSASDPVSKALYVDFKTSLVDGILVKVDRTSMAHGLEVRSPLLDQEVVELAARVPPALKLRRGRGKHLLAQAVADRLPASVVNRRKHGLTTPIGRWLRDEWREIAEDCLFGQQAVARDLFNARFLRSLWTTHLGGGESHAQQLWMLVTLELWQRRQLA